MAKNITKEVMEWYNNSGAGENSPFVMMDASQISPEEIRTMKDRVIDQRTKAFSLSDTERTKYTQWKQQQEEKTKSNYGAIDGAYTFEFTPTSLGIIKHVSNSVTKERTDITDYDNF